MEDPNVIAKATAQHFKPYAIIIGIMLAVCGPALFFHGAAFWLAALAWWVFLATAGWGVLYLYVRHLRK